MIPKQQVKRIDNSGSISFHIVGDTGGTKTPAAQQVVEVAMESDFDHKTPSKNPSFFYHLGDVIYKFGESTEYYSQFYEPYAHYQAPIFAIPGNKDGDVHPNSNAKSLTAFVDNFCAKTVLSPWVGLFILVLYIVLLELYTYRFPVAISVFMNSYFFVRD